MPRARALGTIRRRCSGARPPTPNGQALDERYQALYAECTNVARELAAQNLVGPSLVGPSLVGRSVVERGGGGRQWCSTGEPPRARPPEPDHLRALPCPAAPSARLPSCRSQSPGRAQCRGSPASSGGLGAGEAAVWCVGPRQGLGHKGACRVGSESPPGIPRLKHPRQMHTHAGASPAGCWASEAPPCKRRTRLSPGRPSAH
jgi:hypothetical protein